VKPRSIDEPGGRAVDNYDGDGERAMSRPGGTDPVDGPEWPSKLVYSVAETAALLSVGRTTVYELISTGSLRTIKIGTRRLVARRDLEDFVAGLRGGRRDAG
jgi:excisionase family DNA binding protein